MTPAYIALGSNLQEPARQLCLAVTAVSPLPESRIERVSITDRRAAVGPGTQPD